jgi:hypothetical protein
MTSQEIRKIVDEHLNAEARHDAEAAAATYAPHGYYHHVPLGLLLGAERRLLPVTRRASPRSPTARSATKAKSSKAITMSTGVVFGEL